MLRRLCGLTWQQVDVQAGGWQVRRPSVCGRLTGSRILTPAIPSEHETGTLGGLSCPCGLVIEGVGDTSLPSGPHTTSVVAHH